MKVLVTGGAGFIGSHIVELLQDKADEIMVLDNLRSGYRENLETLNCTFVQGSIMDRALLDEIMPGVDLVFHLAAMISVAESLEKPIECQRINTEGLLNVLEAGKKAGIKKLCFSSSAAVYGDNPTLPKKEEMLPEPISPYAVSKIDGEYYCNIYRREGWVNAVCLRYFNVFGPRQDPGSQYAAAIPIFLAKALKGEEITIYGDGEQTRDFIYVKDIAAANFYAATHEDMQGTYNAAYGSRISIRELAEQLIAQTGSSSKIIFGAPRPGDIKHSYADVQRLRDADFKPGFSFEQGLRETIAFFRGQN